MRGHRRARRRGRRTSIASAARTVGSGTARAASESGRRLLGFASRDRSLHSPGDIKREEEVHPTSGPHTNRARTRLHGDAELSPENPRCFFVVALCLGRFPSRQRAVRNHYRMGRQSQNGFGLPRGMVDHSAGSRQPRANPLGRALSSAASATTNDRMASTRRLHLSGVTSERCAASS